VPLIKSKALDEFQRARVHLTASIADAKGSIETLMAVKQRAKAAGASAAALDTFNRLADEQEANINALRSELELLASREAEFFKWSAMVLPPGCSAASDARDPLEINEDVFELPTITGLAEKGRRYGWDQETQEKFENMYRKIKVGQPDMLPEDRLADYTNSELRDLLKVCEREGCSFTAETCRNLLVKRSQNNNVNIKE
jgi:hypothetical protein